MLSKPSLLNTALLDSKGLMKFPLVVCCYEIVLIGLFFVVAIPPLYYRVLVKDLLCEGVILSRGFILI